MVEARVRRIGMREGVVVTAIFAFGWTLRWWHLGTTSLWWDELVHLSFATAPDPWTVLRQVRAGAPPGAGNAGAVPLDYMLLNLWTWLVGPPAVEQLEVYYRFPSYVWSGATLVALWAYARHAFGRAVGLTATLLLALSVPHVLYAAEARFYSLLMFMSVVNLAAFTWVMRCPELPRAWLTYALVSVPFFLTGLLSLLVLPWQYAALTIRVLRGAGGHGAVRRAGLLVLPVALLGGALALYYAGIDLGARGERPGAGLLNVRDLVLQAFSFMTLEDPRQLGLLVWGVIVAPLYCWRRHRALLPVVLTLLVTQLVSLPVLVELLRWKRYYFHPRHALFLLPGFELLTALGVVGTCAFVVSWIPRFGATPQGRRIATVAALALVLGVRGPAVRDFLIHPRPYFARTKTERDWKSLVRDLRARTTFYAPGEKYLLIGDRIAAGHLGNPTLARYLQWHGLDQRVVLKSTTDIKSILDRLRTDCDGPCRGHPVAEVATSLLLVPPFELARAKQRLLGLPADFGTGPGTVRDVGVLAYVDSHRAPDVSGSNAWPYWGVVLAEPR